jgi:tol-pal system protein YbgF
MRALRSHGVNWIHGAAIAATIVATSSCAIAQAPIIDGGQPVSRSSSSRSNAASTQEGGSSATGALYQQLQTLQQEVSELRGIVEEQRHQLETLKQQSLDRYTDLDSRLSQGQPGQGQPAPGAVAPGAAPVDTPPAEPAPGATAPGAAVPVPLPAAGGMQTAKPEEYEAYQKAYAKLKSQDVGGAIKAFNSFIATYPGSTLAGNAYYWLGKAYLQPPQDAAKAQQAFVKVSGDLPQHAKAPDALYEQGKIAYAKGDKAKAKTLFQQVIDNYGTSGSTAPQLSKQFLDQNFK